MIRADLPILNPAFGVHCRFVEDHQGEHPTGGLPSHSNVGRVAHVLPLHKLIIKMASFTRLFSPALASTPPHSTFPRSRSQWAKVLCIGLSLASMAFASPDDELPDPTSVAAIRLAAIDGEPRPTLAPEPTPTPETVDELVLDDRIAFWDGENWSRLLPAEHELRRRAQAAESVTTTLEIPVSTEPSTTASSSTRTRSTVTITASATTATTTASPLPVFFDGGLSANFTESSCPTFINNMISAPEFNECYPISLLLQVSVNTFMKSITQGCAC